MHESCPHSMGQAANLTRVVVVHKLVFILDKYHSCLFWHVWGYESSTCELFGLSTEYIFQTQRTSSDIL